MRLINTIFAIVLLFSCNKKDNYSSIQVIGHAGMGLAMPNSMYHDNSKEAIEYALLMNGCKGVEVDVQLSKDGKLWLYHDPNLDSQTSISGCIGEFNSSELSSVKYNSLHREKLCRLIDIDSNLLYDKMLYLDIRKVNFCTNSEVNSQQILDALNGVPFLKNPKIHVVMVSNNLSFLNIINANGYKSAYELNENLDFLTIQSMNNFVQELLVKNKNVSADQIANYQSAGLKVTVFEMRSASGIRKALKKNPNAIITDDVREAIIEVN